jgi:peptide/nickel transport system substrate-binding protein
MRRRVALISTFCFIGIVVGVFQAKTNEMTYGEMGNPTLPLNPLTANEEISIRLAELIFDGLVGFDDKGVPKSELAEGNVRISEDETEYTFDLRRGIRWHESPNMVKARDVAATFEFIMERPSAWRDALSFVESVEVVDEYTVRIQLKQPVHGALGRLSFKIIPGRERLRKAMRGTGSFSYQSKTPTTIRLNANRNDVHKPKLDTIYQRSFEDVDVATFALVQQEIDLMPDYPIDKLPLIRGDLRKKPYNTLSIACIGYNMRKSYLQDKRVRRAFTMALNRAGLLERLYFGEGEVIWGPYPPTSAASYNREDINIRYKGMIEGFDGIPNSDRENMADNIDKATDLILQARKDGKFPQKTLIFKVPTPSKGEISARSALYLFFVDALKAIGVEAKYEPVERGKWKVDIFEKHDFDITYIEWSFGDLMDITSLFHSQHRGPNQNNIVGYKHPRVDELLDDSLTTTPEGLVTTIYPELCAIIGDDCPYTFLWSLVRHAGYHRRLRIGKIDPFNFFEYVDGFYIRE